MATPTKVDVSVSFADAAALAAWVSNLAADITAGKVTGFDVSSGKTDGKITGTLTIPTPTDLTTALEDPE
jgi:hypothetical protein